MALPSSVHGQRKGKGDREVGEQPRDSGCTVHRSSKGKEGKSPAKELKISPAQQLPGQEGVQGVLPLPAKDTALPEEASGGQHLPTTSSVENLLETSTESYASTVEFCPDPHEASRSEIQLEKEGQAMMLHERGGSLESKMLDEASNLKIESRAEEVKCKSIEAVNVQKESQAEEVEDISVEFDNLEKGSQEEVHVKSLEAVNLERESLAEEVKVRNVVAANNGQGDFLKEAAVSALGCSLVDTWVKY